MNLQSISSYYSNNKNYQNQQQSNPNFGAITSNGETLMREIIQEAPNYIQVEKEGYLKIFSFITQHAQKNNKIDIDITDLHTPSSPQVKIVGINRETQKECTPQINVTKAALYQILDSILKTVHSVATK